MPETIPNTKAIIEDRGVLYTNLKKLTDTLVAEKREMTKEEQESYDKWSSRFDELGKVLLTAKRAMEMQGEMDEEEPEEPPAEEEEAGRSDPPHGRKPRIGREDFDKPRGAPREVTEEDRALAFKAWMRNQCDQDPSKEEREACERIGIRPNRREFVIPLCRTSEFRHGREQRAQSAGTFTAGGATVSSTLVNSLEVAMLQFGGILQVADVMRTDNGEPVAWPTSDDTSNTGELIGENPSSATEQDVTFGQLVLNAYAYSSKMIRVPNSLMEDSAIDIARVIGEMLGERLGRIQATHMTTGSGASRPKGIVNSSTMGKTTSSATAIAADELIDLQDSIDPAYKAGQVGWMMHQNIWTALRKLKDGNGQYLYMQGLRERVSEGGIVLLGDPVTICQDMQSSIATATKTILYGVLNKYKVRQVREVRFKRLEERYAELDQVAFIAFVRADGGLLDAGTHPVKHMLQA